MANAGSLDVEVRAHDGLTGDPIEFHELSSFNPWPGYVLQAIFNGVAVALAFIALRLAGVV